MRAPADRGRNLGAIARRAWNSPTLTTWASLGTSLGRFVFVLPLVLTRFDSADVAIWYLMFTFTTFMGFLDFGFSATTSRYYSYAMGGATDLRRPREGAIGEPNHQLIGRLYLTLRAVFLPIGFGAAVLVGTVGTLLMAKPVAASPDPVSAWTAWGIVLFGSIVGFIGGMYSTYLQGTNQVALVRRWEAISSSGAIATNVLVLLLGGNLVHLALATLAWTLVNVLRNRWLVHRYAHEPLGRGPIFARDPAVIAAIWSSAWRSGLGVLLNAGIVRLSAGFLAQLANPVELAAYLIAFNFLDRLNQFAQAPFYSRLPALAAAYSQGDREAVTDSSRRGMLLTIGTFVAGVVVIGFAAQVMLDAIGSSTPFIGLKFWFLMAAGLLIHRFGAMQLQLQTLTNKVVWHVADGVSGVLFLVAWLGLFSWIGLYAIPVALILAYGGFYTPYAMAKARTMWETRHVPEGQT